MDSFEGTSFLATHTPNALFNQNFNSEDCFSSVLIGSLDSGCQLIFRVTIYGNAVSTVVEQNKCSKHPNVQDFMKFDKTIFPFALFGYEIGYRQLDAVRLVGYLPSHIQRALVEKLLIE